MRATVNPDVASDGDARQLMRPKPETTYIQEPDSSSESRAYRLDWPDDSVVYELDVPKVLQYKAETLNALGAAPATTRREVAVDLRDDWPAALCDAGFDAAQPTAWLAEGLLPFLPGSAQESMFAAIDGLSAKHSRVAVEVLGLDDERRRDVEERWREVRAERESAVRMSLSTRSPCGTTTRADPIAPNGSARTAGSRAPLTAATSPSDDAPGFLNMFLNKFVTAQKAGGR